MITCNSLCKFKLTVRQSVLYFDPTGDGNNHCLLISFPMIWRSRSAENTCKVTWAIIVGSENSLWHEIPPRKYFKGSYGVELSWICHVTVIISLWKKLSRQQIFNSGIVICPESGYCLCLWIVEITVTVDGYYNTGFSVGFVCIG